MLTLSARGAHTAGHQCVEQQLLPQEHQDLWHVRRMGEGHTRHHDSWQFGAARQQIVAVLLIWQCLQAKTNIPQKSYQNAVKSVSPTGLSHLQLKGAETLFKRSGKMLPICQ